MLEKLQNSRNALGLIFMLPAAVLLLIFLTYPLGLGTWLGFTNAKIGRAGEWIGLENFQFLFGDAVARLSLRSEEHTSELQSLAYLVCRLLLEKKKIKITQSLNITNTSCAER